MTITNDQIMDHARARLEAGLTAAWLRRCGPSGTPGGWDGAELVEILDEDVSVELRVVWRLGNMWSAWIGDRDGAEHCWLWRIAHVHADSLAGDEIDMLERLDFVIDDHHVDLIGEPADSQARPAVPDAVVEAFVKLTSP